MQRTGPPPCSFVANLRGPLQDGHAAKTKPLTRSCLRFWTRAWSQRGLVGEGTGRLRSPAAKRAFPRVGWTFLPSTSVILTNTLMNTHSGRLTHRSGTRAERERNALRANSCLLAQETPPVVHELVEQGPDQSAVPSRGGRPFPEAPSSCSARVIQLLDGQRPHQTTSRPRAC